MKKIFPFLVLLTAVVTGYSQTYQWVKQLGGSSGDVGRAVCTDPSGNVLSAGFFAGTIDLNPGAATNSITAAGTGNSAYISKLDTNGNYIWGIALQASGTGVCEIYGIATDASGNILVTGTFAGSVDFDPGAGTTTLSTTPTGIFAAKYSSAGALTWAKTITGVTSSYGLSIATDASGNVVTTGRFSGNSIDFDPGAGTALITSGGGGQNVFVWKLNSAGDYQWAFQLSVQFTDQGQIVRTDAAGNIYIGGNMSDNCDYDPGAGSTIINGRGNLDGFVAKYTSAGAFVWARTFAGTDVDALYGLAVDAGQNVYVTGSFKGTADLNPDTATNNVTSAGAEDIYIAKLNSNGSFAWVKTIGGTGVDIPTCLSLGTGGVVYVSGYFESTVDFDPSAATSSKTSFGGKDGFVVSLNGLGNFNWVKQVGGPTDDQTYSVIGNTGNQNIYFTGGFTGTANFNSPSTANLTSGGAADAYVERITYMCTGSTTATVSSNVNSVCSGSPVTLSVATGALNSATGWQWYTNGCGVTSAGTGTSITVNPTANTTYSVRGEGGCVTPGICGTKTISVTPTVTPEVTLTATDTNVCAGTSITFTATPVNGGASPMYIWRRNGVLISGVTGNTYTTTTYNNNDVFYLQMTSNATCASPAFDISNEIAVHVSSPSTPTIIINTAQTTICAGTSATFTSTISNGGNAPQYQWKKNGVNISGATSSTYTSSTLANGDVISCQLTSNAACTSPNIVVSGGLTMTVNPTVTPTISINASATSICSGTSVTFTSTITNGGSSPAYQWKKNGLNISGATSSTYTTTTLANNDVIICQLTSNVACATSASNSSNGVIMTVTPTQAASVSITASQTSICSGASVTFTATPVNAGPSPTLQWKVNNQPVGTNSTTFTSTSLTNNAVVWVTITPNAQCFTLPDPNSNTITMTVSPQVTPAVSITATQTTICSGNSVTFTATPTNGGTTPVYQWKLNGSNVGTNSPTYTNAALANNDVVTCVLTSNAACATSPTATSNALTITVSGTVTPSVSISAPSTSVCTGGSVTFTAAPVNGGSTPTYQWKKNGTNISGATQATYTASAPANGDVFSCVLTSSVSCASPATATSNSLTVTLVPVVAPAISITNTTGAVCTGGTINFTSSITNGGANPAYQWKRNGSNIAGAVTANYSDNTPANGDAITCALTSNAQCAAPATVSSNSLTEAVTAPVTPAVSISASQSTICSGNSVTFTATATNGGTTPAYQWKLNGNNVGTNSATYTNASLANNDQISCVLTSNAACVTAATATSNTITIAVSGTVVPSVSVAATATTICAGQPVTFTATPVNGGTTPAYQWKKNGTNISGATQATYTTTGAASGDVYTCVLTSSVSCASPTTATGNNITITVNPAVSASVSINAPSLNICQGDNFTATAVPVNGGNSPTYQWKLNATTIPGATGASLSTSQVSDDDVITVEMVSSDVCATPSPAVSAGVMVNVTAPVTPSVSVSASQTTVCSGTTVTFTATPVNGGSTPAYVWTLNGTPVNGATGSTYATATLGSGDQVGCVLTSSETCVTAALATSNTVTITTTTTGTASVTVNVASATVCTGEEVTFTTTSVEGGSAPTYRWFKNTVVIPGEIQSTYTTTSLANNDAIHAEMTSNSTCVTQPVVTSTPVTMTVNTLPDVTVTTSGNTLSVPAGNTYQWLDCGSLSEISGAGTNSYTATATGSYAVAVSSNGCADTSDCVSLTIIGIGETTLPAFKLFPVPATDVVTVVADDVTTTTGISAVDKLGNRIALPYTVQGNQIQVDITQLAVGIYTMQLGNGKQLRTARFIKAD
jgi:hypothetical protein